MQQDLFPAATPQMSRKRASLAPASTEAFRAFNRQVFADGALSPKIKQVIAVAVAQVTQCPYCIRGHTKQAARLGATPEELMEAVWVAAEMRAGAAYAHSALVLDELGLLEDGASAEGGDPDV